MARRDYVSFLGERRRFGEYDAGPDPRRWLWIISALVVLALSLWWFGFRDADDAVGSERVLEDSTIPTLLTPVAVDDADTDGLPENLECRTLVQQWSTFQGGNERQGCVTAPRIESPRIFWRTEIGVSGWLNNPVIEDGAVFVGSAGVVQFSPDRRDGIYSLDLETGQQRWLYTTELDVNAVSVRGGTVVATGDEGRIWALEADDGDLVWSDDLQVGVYGSPLLLEDIIVVGAGDGSINFYNYGGGRNEEIGYGQLRLDGPIRGGPSADDERIYVASEGREVVALNFDGQQVWRTRIEARGAGADEARIFSAPTITEELVIVTLVRSDVGADPAIVALDRETGEVVWQAQDQAFVKGGDWANIRSSPAAVGDLLVYAEGYSNELVIIDLATGETVWSAGVGPYCYPHWPSVAINSGYAYVARHDGGLYAVDLEAQETEFVWEINLGQLEGVGAFPDDHECLWGPPDGYSILASPAVSPEGLIVVGTLGGQLIGVGDSSW